MAVTSMEKVIIVTMYFYRPKVITQIYENTGIQEQSEEFIL